MLRIVDLRLPAFFHKSAARCFRILSRPRVSIGIVMPASNHVNRTEMMNVLAATNACEGESGSYDAAIAARFA